MNLKQLIFLFISIINLSCASRISLVERIQENEKDPVCLNRGLDGVFRYSCNAVQLDYIEFKKYYDYEYQDD